MLFCTTDLLGHSPNAVCGPAWIPPDLRRPLFPEKLWPRTIISPCYCFYFEGPARKDLMHALKNFADLAFRLRTYSENKARFDDDKNTRTGGNARPLLR